MAINYIDPPMKRQEDLEARYGGGVTFTIENILKNKETFESTYQDLIDLMKYDFEKEEFRKGRVTFKFKSKDKKTYETTLARFIGYLIFWNPLIEVNKVGLLDESWIFDFSKFNSKSLLQFIDDKLLPIYDTDFATQNAMVDDLYHNIICISHAFCMLMGMGVSLYDLKLLEKRDPEVSHLIRDPIDTSLEPHEVEELLSNRNKRLIEKLVADPQMNDYKPFFASGAGLKEAQFREYLVGIGFKADINGNTVPILIDNSFLLDGLNKPSYVYLNAISGRKALILSKLSMGQPGAFSKKLTMNSLTSTLREDNECCDSFAAIEYYITDDQFLKMLNGRYYYDSQGNMRLLDYNRDKDLIGKIVRFRSPITCTSQEGVCKYCYGHMFDINKSMASAGALASLKITEPIGQSVLSSKHSQSTSSNELKFSEGYDELFETNSSTISLNSNSSNEDDLYMEISNVQVEEMDDSEYYFIDFFDIVDKNGNFIRRIEEASGAKLYLNDTLISAFKQRSRSNRDGALIISLDDFEDDEDLFTIEVKNKELTEPLKIFTKLLNSHEHMGATTISQMCQIFAEKLLQMGIKYEFVHAEMILKPFIRKKSNVLEYPDFGLGGNHKDYQILKLDESQLLHPSALMSIPFGYLRRQLLSPTLYEKTKTGPLDALYLTQPNMYIG